MKSKNQELTTLINSLIKINNDRVEGYEKAIAQCREKGIAMVALFRELADESRDNVSVLRSKVESLRGEAAVGTSLSGKLHRAIMNAKWKISGLDINAIMVSCIIGDKTAVRAYSSALESNAEMSSATRQMLISQKESMIHGLERMSEERQRGNMPVAIAIAV